MSSTKKKKKFPWKSIVMIAVFLGGSFGVGWLIGSLSKPVFQDVPLDKFLLGLFGLYVCFLLSSFLQIVIHEAGHLVFGLLTGYQYSSFRIGSFMWVKLDGKIKLKRFSLSGTGGQCLMAPPDMKDGKMPYLLYNMGGCIANLVVSVIPLVLVLMFRKPDYIFFLVVIWAAVGLFYTVINGVPIKKLTNDGYNVLSLGKSPEALQAFWLQMKINEQEALGKRMRDLPEEWFQMPTEEGMKNSMVATNAVLVCSRLLDTGNYEEAARQIERLINEKNGMVVIHKQLLKAELVYCELVGENRPEKLEELYSEELQKFLKTMKKSPSTYRVQYLYAKYVEKDEKKAATAMAGFEKVAKTYPYPHEIAGEREMLAYAEEKLEDEEVSEI